MKKQEWEELREQKLTELSRRFRNTIVTIALNCKSGAGVFNAFENVEYYIKDYAKFLDENSVDEEINEPQPEPERYGGRDGVRDRGYTHCEADGELEGSSAGSRSSKGDEGKEAEGDTKCDGSA